MQVHHHSKDRNNAVTFPAHSVQQRRILRAIPQIVELPKRTEIALTKSAPAPQSFSPLIQEFLDECGYSDK